MTVIRYIHQNPAKAGLVKKLADWKWSSYIGYCGEKTYPPGLLDSHLILSIFPKERTNAIAGFKEFNGTENEDKCLDNETNKRLTDDQARDEIKKIISVTEIAQVKISPKLLRDEIILKVKKIKGLTQRQAARILGISPNLIFNVGSNRTVPVIPPSSKKPKQATVSSERSIGVS